MKVDKKNMNILFVGLGAFGKNHLAAWRQQRLLASRKRGRKGRSESEKRVEQLERENARLRKQLEQAKTIISVQKKVSELFGVPLEQPSDEESN